MRTRDHAWRLDGVGTTGISVTALEWNGHIVRGNAVHRHRDKLS